MAGFGGAEFDWSGLQLVRDVASEEFARFTQRLLAILQSLFVIAILNFDTDSTVVTDLFECTEKLPPIDIATAG